MATQISEAESRLTDRYQTTVPESVRRALGLGKRDTLVYTLLDDGSVQLSRANDDPALAPFLALLTEDIARHPENLQAIPIPFSAASTTSSGIWTLTSTRHLTKTSDGGYGCGTRN